MPTEWAVAPPRGVDQDRPRSGPGASRIPLCCCAASETPGKSIIPAPIGARTGVRGADTIMSS